MEAFRPFEEKGTPLELQYRSWNDIVKPPYNKREVDCYTRARGILMNGIENFVLVTLHEWARHTDDPKLKGKIAELRRAEEQQQTTIDWHIPADQSILETTLAYEQVAVDLTANLAKNEPDPYVKHVFDFGLLEDFDHLYRYANLLELVENKTAEKITGEYTEITVGRPTSLEHRHPYDDVRKPYDGKSAEFLTKLHVLTITAGEQQTMNFYMNVGNRPGE